MDNDKDFIAPFSWEKQNRVWGSFLLYFYLHIFGFKLSGQGTKSLSWNTLYFLLYLGYFVFFRRGFLLFQGPPVNAVTGMSAKQGN